MKTTIITIAAVVTLALGTLNAKAATTNNNNDGNAVVLNNISKINKIEVHGNVELYVSDGTADQVKVYNHYYAENALVQSQNGVLRISSYKTEKLVVWVTANDLQAISAYDNSQVRSFGKLTELELNVDLHNNAVASLNLSGYNTTINVNDNAKADITGNVTQCELKYDHSSTVNTTNFAADTLNKVARPAKAAPKTEMEILAEL